MWGCEPPREATSLLLEGRGLQLWSCGRLGCARQGGQCGARVLRFFLQVPNLEGSGNSGVYPAPPALGEAQPRLPSSLVGQPQPLGPCSPGLTAVRRTQLTLSGAQEPLVDGLLLPTASGVC